MKSYTSSSFLGNSKVSRKTIRRQNRGLYKVSLYVIGELPISSTDFETNKVNPYNDAILNNLSTYTALGMTKFIDPRNITNMNTYVNLAANYLVADQIHLNDAGTTALSNYIKTESGL